MTLKSLIDKIARRSPAELGRELERRGRVALKLERGPGGRALAPYALSFWVTRRCNLNCDMCWVQHSRDVEGEAYVRAESELTLDELKAVVDDVARWRPRVGVTGGEPFLRRDAVDFVRHVKGRGLRCGVNTNGTFLTRDAGALVEAGLDSVMVSVDGPPEVHDRQRGAPGSFVRAKEGIDALLAARASRGAGAPYVKITCTITDDNVSSLATLPALFLDLPLDEFTFQHLWFTDAATADAQRALFNELFGQDTTYLQGFVSRRFPPVNVAVLRKQVAAVNRKSWPFAVNFYPDLNGRDLNLFYDNPRHAFRRKCFSRWLRADILPDGTVTPCLGLEVGNVRETPFTEIWNGPAYRAFRREVARRGVFPGCSRCCGLFSD